MRLDSLLQVVTGSKIIGSAKLEGVLPLGISSRYGGHLCAHGLSKKDSHVTETADTNDTDALALGTNFKTGEGAVDGDTTTKHGRSNIGLKARRNGDSKLRRSSPVLGKTTSGNGALAVGATVIGVVECDGLGSTIVFLAYNVHQYSDVNM